MAQIVFENARLFDGEQREMPDGMSVVVEEREIREVSDRPVRARGARRIDCGGRTLMPGLIDCHVHVYAATLKLGAERRPPGYYALYAAKFLTHILGCGFTTVRDVGGGDHALSMALHDGHLEGPRYFYGGLALSQTGGHGDLRGSGEATDFCSCGALVNPLAVIADGVDACTKAAREELRKGADHIKIMASGGVMSPSDPLDRCQYSGAEIAAIVEECERRGSYVAAHCHPDEAVRRCVELGVRSIEHATLITPETARLVAERGAFAVPTFAVMGALLEDGKEMGVPQRNLDKLMMIHDHALRGLEVMHEAGVKIALGTDLLAAQHTRQGSEFTLRAQALGAFDILRSATAVGAELLGMEGRLGCIRPGALADLILVEGNPLEDLGPLASGGKHLPVIMCDGRLVKCEV